MSYGQTLLREFLTLLLGPHQPLLEDYRPTWLHGMELDLYYPALHLAFEFQGDQHFFPTSLSANPNQQQVRDRRKHVLCRQQGITLRSIQAIDLEYNRLAAKLTRIFKRPARVELAKALPGLRPALRELNKLAVAYRKTLNSSYGAATSRKKGGRPRKQAIASLIAVHGSKSF